MTVLNQIHKVFVLQNYKYITYRNGQFSILTGWGGGKGNSTRLQKVNLKVLPQSECNRRYTVSEYHSKRQLINNNLPKLFQDNLLCAAVCRIKLNVL